MLKSLEEKRAAELVRRRTLQNYTESSDSEDDNKTNPIYIASAQVDDLKSVRFQNIVRLSEKKISEMQDKVNRLEKEISARERSLPHESIIRRGPVGRSRTYGRSGLTQEQFLNKAKLHVAKLKRKIAYRTEELNDFKDTVAANPRTSAGSPHVLRSRNAPVRVEEFRPTSITVSSSPQVAVFPVSQKAIIDPQKVEETINRFMTEFPVSSIRKESGVIVSNQPLHDLRKSLKEEISGKKFSPEARSSSVINSEKAAALDKRRTDLIEKLTNDSENAAKLNINSEKAAARARRRAYLIEKLSKKEGGQVRVNQEEPEDPERAARIRVALRAEYDAALKKEIEEQDIRKSVRKQVHESLKKNNG
ncbi:unnamed protein product [Sphagnum jensenii]